MRCFWSLILCQNHRLQRSAPNLQAAHSRELTARWFPSLHSPRFSNPCKVCSWHLVNSQSRVAPPVSRSKTFSPAWKLCPLATSSYSPVSVCGSACCGRSPEMGSWAAWPVSGISLSAVRSGLHSFLRPNHFQCVDGPHWVPAVGRLGRTHPWPSWATESWLGLLSQSHCLQGTSADLLICLCWSPAGSGGRCAFLDISGAICPSFQTRQQMKNKTSCHAPPLPASGLTSLTGILLPGRPTWKTARSELCLS